MYSLKQMFLCWVRVSFNSLVLIWYGIILNIRTQTKYELELENDLLVYKYKL